MKAALPSGAEAFFTAVAPASTGYNARNDYYSSDREYVYAIADALKQEYHAIIDAGLLLQVDDAVLANMYDYLVQQSPEHYREWAQLRVDALNHALSGIPEDRVRYHVCFGSWHVPHVADAPLEDMAELILQVRAGAYSIEAANPRHEHEWRVWQSHTLPEGKSLIPGIVTHHLTTVEHPRWSPIASSASLRLWGKRTLLLGQTAASRRARGYSGYIRVSCGPSSSRWWRARNWHRRSCGANAAPPWRPSSLRGREGFFSEAKQTLVDGRLRA